MIKVNAGDIVSTRRRKAMTVIALVKRGWIDVRTASGKIISISTADVTRVW